MIMNRLVRRYRPRGQTVTAFRYTDPQQSTQLLDWISRIEGRTVHGRVTPGGVVEIRDRSGQEVSVPLGSFVVRTPDTSGWAVQNESKFFDQFEPMPPAASVFPDGAVA